MMLRKLILEGFKSFADKTEFEFDKGISCVVGPNGCGKSNIVDAVKWVLGEQSAKSLRGSEMADVIFNGSANRPPSGLAQVTLVFDNHDGQLRLSGADGEEHTGMVSISRRLYRSGHGEYGINKQPARLKDIREMFMDTGLGRDAYSLIEQGRVERFLQASGDQRRAIFDEAAGINKYKARRREALLKLDRVEQNLLRLSDILAEVDKRLRSIKYQAGKARNYQSYVERLRELRSLYLLAQYHGLSDRRRRLQQEVDAWTDKVSAVETRIEQLGASQSATEVELDEVDRTARELRQQISQAAASGQSAAQQAEMLTRRVEELGQQIVSLSARCEAGEARIDSHRRRIEQRREQLEEIDRKVGAGAEQIEQLSHTYQTNQHKLGRIESELEDEKAGTIDLLRRTAELHNEIQAYGTRQQDLAGRRRRLSDRAEQIGAELEQLLTDRAAQNEKLKDIQEVLGESHARLEKARADREMLAAEQRRIHELRNGAREKRSAVRSRTEALEEMQRRMEGIGAGAKAALEASLAGRGPKLLGMLGQFIDTDVEDAGVVAAALGGAEQMLLAERHDDVAAWADRLAEWTGGKGAAEILPLDRLGPLRSDLDLQAIPAAATRAIDLVRCDAALAPVLWRLLGHTLVVETLAEALAAVDSPACPPEVRFVTRCGDLICADGRIRIGAAKASVGLISRRSELARLGEEADALDRQIDEHSEQLDQVATRGEHLEEVVQNLRTAVYEANTEKVTSESHLSRLDEKISALQSERPVVDSDLEALAEQIDQAVHAEHEARQQAAELEQRNRQREEAIGRLTEQSRRLQDEQARLSEELTQRKVQRAAVEQERQSTAAAIDDLQTRLEQMNEELASDRAEIAAARERRSEAESQIEQARERARQLRAWQEQLEATVRESDQTRVGLQQRLEEIRAELTTRRGEKDRLAEELSASKVRLGETEAHVQDLIGRAGDELDMDLPARYAEYEHDEQRDWDAVAAEIDELRQKIERLGNVNLDAIGEQEQLETRREFLGGQLDDVRQSREKLTALIKRINTQSREQFLEAFESIRTNFQELFRKLFGGGKADMMLLDPEDVLESPIEIYARPPGKELRSLSLLSGGEKSMTAIAMLFAMFRSRPSPFCLLDEIDAALDETNNERFNHMLGQFTADTQFVIISHAKRTMSMANVLYGVTMQEAGVSKRISVRFDQVADGRADRALAPVGS